MISGNNWTRCLFVCSPSLCLSLYQSLSSHILLSRHKRTIPWVINEIKCSNRQLIKNLILCTENTDTIYVYRSLMQVIKLPDAAPIPIIMENKTSLVSGNFGLFLLTWAVWCVVQNKQKSTSAYKRARKITMDLCILETGENAYSKIISLLFQICSTKLIYLLSPNIWLKIVAAN